MFKKFKLALVTATVLVGGFAGIAAAEGRPGDDQEARGDRAAMKQKFDANKDGKLDEAEKQAMHDERAALRFKALDKDGDGKLSLAEFKAGRGERHGRRGKGGPGGMGGMGGHRGHGGPNGERGGQGDGQRGAGPGPR